MTIALPLSMIYVPMVSRLFNRNLLYHCHDLYDKNKKLINYGQCGVQFLRQDGYSIGVLGRAREMHTLENL